MEFLYKLYSNNYFGIGLFLVITILAFAFLIILFFGKKDEKKRLIKESETEKETINESVEPILVEEESIIQDNNTVELEPISLDNSYLDKNNEKSEDTLEVIEESSTEEMDPFATNNIVLNTDYISEEPVEEETTNTDIYNLDSIINEDEIDENNDETIDDVLNKYEAIEETVINTETEENYLPKEENYINKEENEWKDFDKSNDNSKTSAPFSSVYLTKEEAETKSEENIEPPKTVVSSQPKFEMPKRMDLPKKNSGAINENIISSLKEKGE